MQMNEFMKTRKSIRDFKNRGISESDLQSVQKIVDAVNEISKSHGVIYKLFKEGQSIHESLEGLGGYAGVMIDAPSYISMELTDIKDESYIYGAYYLEDIITQINDLEIGSCWISLHNVSDEVLKKVFDSNNTIKFALGIGYPAPMPGIGQEQYSSRLGLEDFIYMNSFDTNMTVEELENYGLDELFYYLRFAPSAYNKQPWRFLINGSDVELYINDYQGEGNLVDSGIIMYYYVKLAEANGVTASWTLSGGEDKGKNKFIAKSNY